MRPAPRTLLPVLLLAALAGPAAAQDSGEGQIIFNQRCSVCHTLTRSTEETRRSGLDQPEDLAPQNPTDAGREAHELRGQETVVSSLRRGPHLSGLIGRRPGGLDGFAYGEDYTAYRPEWSPETLDAWIVVHDDGRTDAAARGHIIAYLRTLRAQ